MCCIGVVSCSEGVMSWDVDGCVVLCTGCEGSVLVLIHVLVMHVFVVTAVILLQLQPSTTVTTATTTTIPPCNRITTALPIFSFPLHHSCTVTPFLALIQETKFVILSSGEE